ncbi:MAG: hypothetical protein AAF761_05415 [Pseudomonadota bacterium]
MPKTMKKADVIYRAAFARFDMGRITGISGKAIPSAVKNGLQDVKRAIKAGELKNVEMKIGTIEGNLFLRIKAGKTYVDDYLLIRNYAEAGPSEAPVRDRAYQRKVDDYIETRVAAYDQLKAGEQAIKAMKGELETMLDLAQGLADEAKRGGFGTNNPGERAAVVLRDAVGLATEAKRVFDRNVHPPFDTHRNFKKPDGVDTLDIDEYGRSFYLSKWRPVYGKAKEYVKLCNTTVAQIRAAAKNARNFADHAEAAALNYKSMAEELAALAEQEVEDATQVWGLQPVDGVARAVTQDGTNMAGLRSQESLPQADLEKLTERYLTTASERMVSMNNGIKRLKTHQAKMVQILGRAKTIPKEMLRDKAVKAAVKRMQTADKALLAYVKSCATHAKAATAAFAKVKKVAAEV